MFPRGFLHTGSLRLGSAFGSYFSLETIDPFVLKRGGAAHPIAGARLPPPQYSELLTERTEKGHAGIVISSCIIMFLTHSALSNVLTNGFLFMNGFSVL